MYPWFEIVTGIELFLYEVVMWYTVTGLKDLTVITILKMIAVMLAMGDFLPFVSEYTPKNHQTL